VRVPASYGFTATARGCLRVSLVPWPAMTNLMSAHLEQTSGFMGMGTLCMEVNMYKGSCM